MNDHANASKGAFSLDSRGELKISIEMDTFVNHAYDGTRACSQCRRSPISLARCPTAASPKQQTTLGLARPTRMLLLVRKNGSRSRCNAESFEPTDLGC